MAPTVLELVIDSFKPKKRGVTKKHVVAVLNIAAKLLGSAVLKQPAFIPLQVILGELLQSAPTDEGEGELHVKRVLRRITALKQKMANVSDIEQRKIKEQIDALYDLLHE